MGRIDEAWRRSNLDASQGTGAEMPTPPPSPWGVEQHGNRDDPEPDTASAPAAAASADRSATGTDDRPARWQGGDARAIERLVVSEGAGPLLVERFRSLAATLLRAQGEQHLKSIIVTSASPGDGKSYVAVNLALTLSNSFRRRVLLIDADLRRPTLHLLLRVPNVKGLGQALKAETDEKLAVVKISETLALVPAGRTAPDPLGGLSSGRMRRIVADAASEFDWVIIDSPPVGLLADARLVSEMVDAALLVVRAGGTRFQDLEAAADAMGHERILGIVLNGVEAIDSRDYGYYYTGDELGRA